MLILFSWDCFEDTYGIKYLFPNPQIRRQPPGRDSITFILVSVENEDVGVPKEKPPSLNANASKSRTHVMLLFLQEQKTAFLSYWSLIHPVISSFPDFSSTIRKISGSVFEEIHPVADLPRTPTHSACDIVSQPAMLCYYAYFTLFYVFPVCLLSTDMG